MDEYESLPSALASIVTGDIYQENADDNFVSILFGALRAASIGYSCEYLNEDVNMNTTVNVVYVE